MRERLVELQKTPKKKRLHWCSRGNGMFSRRGKTYAK